MMKSSPSQHARFPADMAATLLLLFGPLIIGLPLGSFLFHFGAPGLVAVGAASSVTGVVTLLLARLPLYRARRYFSFGSRHLDDHHKRLYRRAYIFIAVGVVLLSAAIVFPV